MAEKRNKRELADDCYYLYIAKSHLNTLKPELYAEKIRKDLIKHLGSNKLQMASVCFDRIQIHPKYRLTYEEQKEIAGIFSFEKLNATTEPVVFKFSESIYSQLVKHENFAAAIEEDIAETVPGCCHGSIQVKQGYFKFLIFRSDQEPCFQILLAKLQKKLEKFFGKQADVLDVACRLNHQDMKEYFKDSDDCTSLVDEPDLTIFLMNFPYEAVPDETRDTIK